MYQSFFCCYACDKAVRWTVLSLKKNSISFIFFSISKSFTDVFNIGSKITLQNESIKQASLSIIKSDVSLKSVEMLSY